MPNLNDFFTIKNTLFNISDEEKKQTSDYLEPIKALARTTYKSIYIIDYQLKGFEYVSENPLFLCGHTAEEVKQMGYSFYFKYVVKEDLDLLLKINTVGFDFYDKLPIEDRKNYTITYDFHIRNNEGKTILINQKLTPIFLNNEGKIWKAMCIVSLSAEHESGNIKIYKTGGNEIFHYNLHKNYWSTNNKIGLTDREKEILHYSARGYTINDISEAIFISPDTIKFHRRKLFNKLGVVNISEAIAYVTNNKLI